MTLPRVLRIGGAVYRVRRLPRGAANYGETDHAARTVRIARDLPPAVAARTLAHEALHVMIDESGLAGDPALAKIEERIVAALEAPLASFIAGNPAALRFIAEGLRR